MSKARNPRNFPQMKVRGARRRRIAPLQRMAGSFDRFGSVVAATATAMVNLTQQMKGSK